jgi:hypothetical protein
MSSLQKFHRRTNVIASGGGFSFTTIGSGNATVGFWLANNDTSKVIVAPKSTELTQAIGLAYGSNNIVRGTNNVTVGLANTNTLYSFGSTAHPQAYYCKSLTSGGYNTWYLPAKNELISMISNKNATPFATTNGMSSSDMYGSSTEYDGSGSYVWGIAVSGTSTPNKTDKTAIRAVRMV